VRLIKDWPSARSKKVPNPAGKKYYPGAKIKRFIKIFDEEGPQVSQSYIPGPGTVKRGHTSLSLSLSSLSLSLSSPCLS
jgi:hypothetical protein